MKQKILIPSLGLIALFGASILGLVTVKRVQAETTNPSIVEKIAERFDLKESEVEGVFEKERQARFQERQKFQEQKLTEAVNNGVITEGQKQALLAKWTEMEEAQQKIRDDYQKWLEDQGIELNKLGPYGGFGSHTGPGGGGMKMMGRW